jgi:ketosteroid isomerase-like protein
MSVTKNRDVVKSFFAAVYAADFDHAFDAFTRPEFSWIVGSDANGELRTAIPWAGFRLIGREGYLGLVKMLFGEFEALSFEPLRYFEAGETVFVEGRFRFRHRQTTKIADSDWLARFDMRDGRISGGQFYENTYAVAAARQRMRSEEP